MQIIILYLNCIIILYRKLLNYIYITFKFQFLNFMKNIILRGTIFDIRIYLLFIYCKNFQLEERSIKKRKIKINQTFRYQSGEKFKF